MSQVQSIAIPGGGGGGTVTSVSAGNSISITGTPTINPTVNVAGTTNHAIQLGNATASLSSLTLGSSGQVLSSQGAGVDPHWITPTAGTVTSVTGGNNITITGTGTINPTVNVSGTTDHSLQVGNASGSLTSLSVASDGQIPIGSSGANPVIANITGTDGITVTNGAGTIAIGNSSPSLTWVDVPSSPTLMNINTAYVASSGGGNQFTLPVTAPFGSLVSVVANGNPGWIIFVNTGQTIYFGNQTTTTSTGTLESTGNRDTVILVCVTADTEWQVWNGPQGNLYVS